MKALILSGGFGNRLKSMVYDRPKSMALVAGIPFLEHQIRLLKGQGITEIILCVSFMADTIKSYFGNGNRIGINITYSEEEVPLGTAGAIKNAEKYIEDTFLVINGDSYTQVDLKNFLEFHREYDDICTMSLSRTEDPGKNGTAVLKENRIIDFVGKIQGENLGISGVYVFNPKIFDYIEKDKRISLEEEILPKLAREGRLIGKIHKGYSIIIGVPETYQKFKDDVLNSLFLRRSNTIRDAVRKMENNGIKMVLIVDEEKCLLGIVTEKLITEHLLMEGGPTDNLGLIMNEKPIVLKEIDSRDKIEEIFEMGHRFIPIVNYMGKILGMEFYEEKIEKRSFPVVRGRSPLRISFAGGSTDLPYFFEKHGGAVINATINKYCHATIIKRADNKIIINSDISGEYVFDSVNSLGHDGKIDLIIEIVKIMNPDFGFELYLHNDIPPGRGLGSSACLAVLIISLFNHLMDLKYNAYKIAEIAYKVETEKLKIKGGWQDQYSTVMGGFNYMEFNKNGSIVYPLRLKKEIIDELESHMMLCYIGQSRISGHIHEGQEQSFFQEENEKTEKLKKLKKQTYEISEALLRDNLSTFGRLLNDSWIIKKSLSDKISNDLVDTMYDIGMKHGAYGGKLLGAGSGGYLLFFYSPKRRNELAKVLIQNGGEILDFGFDEGGAKIWTTNNMF